MGEREGEREEGREGGRKGGRRWGSKKKRRREGEREGGRKKKRKVGWLILEDKEETGSLTLILLEPSSNMVSVVRQERFSIFVILF